jgi:formate-dependent nitrite reductase cytochrome c552 subunit
MKEGTYHICKQCKTEHYSDDEKVLIQDPWNTWKLHYVCKTCGYNKFSQELMLKNLKSEINSSDLDR